MKSCLSTLVLLLSTCLVFGAEIEGPDKVKLQRTVKLTVKDLPKKAKPKWYVVPLDGQDEAEIEWITTKGDESRWIGPAGRYRVTVKWGFVDADGAVEFDELGKVVTIGEGGPIPPQPPGPGPGPGPAPVIAGNLRVLMLYESQDETKIPRGQQLVLYGRTVREYLNAKCVKDKNQPGYRIWDKDTDATADDKVWQELMEKYKKAEKTSLPWVIIQNDKAFFQGPLPENPEKALELLSKYGG